MIVFDAMAFLNDMQISGGILWYFAAVADGQPVENGKVIMDNGMQVPISENWTRENEINDERFVVING